MRTLALLACALTAGCASVGASGTRAVGWLTPYKPEIVQGNFVSREQVQALQPGMSRLQVREILGTPLVTSLFHGDRWDYVFTIKRQGVDPQSYRFVVYFKDDQLERFEGDAMLSEAEFVSRLTPPKKVKLPPLEATEDDLKRYPPPAPAEAAAPEAPLPASYPPLEP